MNSGNITKESCHQLKKFWKIINIYHFRFISFGVACKITTYITYIIYVIYIIWYDKVKEKPIDIGEKVNKIYWKGGKFQK